MTLDDLIRSMAARGELSHLSLALKLDGSGWRASFSPASNWTVSIAEHRDPATALQMAIEDAKVKRAPRKVIADEVLCGPDGENIPIPDGPFPSTAELVGEPNPWD